MPMEYMNEEARRRATGDKSAPCSSVIDVSLLEALEHDALEAMDSAKSEGYRYLCSGEARAYRKLINMLIRHTNRR